MIVSDAGLRFIAQWEGFSPVLYDDPSPARNCTIGYGYMVHEGPCDGRDDEKSWQAGITEEQGLTLLRETVAAYANCVERSVYVPLTEPQFDALSSLTYNIGQGGFINSPVRQAVNAGGDVCAALDHHIYAAGVVLPGLVNRRKAECVLYYQPEQPATEDSDMKPILVWCSDLSQTWIVGPFGAAPVAFPVDAAALQALYGAHACALTSAQLQAIAAA